MNEAKKAVEDNGIVFIGAENGLFRIVGNSSEQFTQSNSPLGKGYIADLHITGNKLFISEFGNGVAIGKQSNIIDF